MVHRRIILLSFLSLVGLVANYSPVSASSGTYPEPRNMYWRPTWGYVATQNLGDQQSDRYHGRVNEYFSWLSFPSLSRIAARGELAPQDATYEHELRFFSDGANFRWCFDAPHDTFTNLPQGYYRDTLSDAGEYSWGMPAYRLTYNSYSIEFKCRKSYDEFGQRRPINPEFNLTSQIGHCHRTGDSCYSSSRVYSDSTMKQIPRRMGRAPSSGIYFYESFSMNPSFEAQAAPWATTQGTTSRICDNPQNAYQGKCYLRLAAGSSGASIQYAYQPPLADLGTAQVKNDVNAKCPVAGNTDGCVLKLEVQGLRNNGVVVSSAQTSFSLARSDTWKGFHVQPGPWDSTVVKWRFLIKSDPNDVLHVDYNQQWYERPA